jgi:hypothetical protein
MILLILKELKYPIKKQTVKMLWDENNLYVFAKIFRKSYMG